MKLNPRGDLNTPDRFADYASLTDCCPVCGEAIAGLDADDRTTIQPCGHSAAGLTTQTMTSTTDTDEHRVMTDGGEDDLPADIVSITNADYANIDFSTGVLSTTVESESVKVGTDVHQHGRLIGLHCGTPADYPRADIGVYQSLSVEQAREIRDGLDEAIEKVEELENAPEPDPRSFADRLREVVNR